MPKILPLGDPILRKKARAVLIKDSSSRKIQEIVRQIKERMKKIKQISPEHGNGLCAPQLGHSRRIMILFFDGKHHVYLNPRITWKSDGMIPSSEGCLSFFYLRGYVKRHEKVRVSAFDELGQKVESLFSGRLAALAQHELDHLNGVLYLDKIKDLREVVSIDERYRDNPKKLQRITNIINYVT